MAERRMLVDEVNSRARTEIAQGTRFIWRVFVNVGEPTTESNFARMLELYLEERRLQPFPQDGHRVVGPHEVVLPGGRIGSAGSGVHRAQEQHHAAGRVEVGREGDDHQPP